MRRRILLGLVLALMACEKKTEVIRVETVPAPTAPPVTTETGGGGMDGSGGDAQGSTSDEVETWTRRLWFQLPKTIERFESLISQMNEIGTLEKAWHMDRIAPIFDRGYQGYSLSDVLPKLKLNLQDKPCLEGSEEKDGSYSLDGTICLSKDRLRRIPKQDLPGEIFGLIFHELAHSASADETTAKAFQGAMVNYSNFGITRQNPLVPAGEDSVFGFLSTDLDEFFVHAIYDKLRIQSPTGKDFCRWTNRIRDEINVLSSLGGPTANKPTWKVSPKAFSILESMMNFPSPMIDVCFGKPMDLAALEKLNSDFTNEFWVGSEMRNNDRPFPSEKPQFMGTFGGLTYQAMAPFFGKDLKDIPNTEYDKISCELVTKLPTGKIETQKFKAKNGMRDSSFEQISLVVDLPKDGDDQGWGKHSSFSVDLRKNWVFRGLGFIPQENSPFVLLSFSAFFFIVDESENSKMTLPFSQHAILQKDSISKVSWSFRLARNGDLKPFKTRHKITCVLEP